MRYMGRCNNVPFRWLILQEWELERTRLSASLSSKADALDRQEQALAQRVLHVESREAEVRAAEEALRRREADVRVSEAHSQRLDHSVALVAEEERATLSALRSQLDTQAAEVTKRAEALAVGSRTLETDARRLGHVDAVLKQQQQDVEHAKAKLAQRETVGSCTGRAVGVLYGL